jgi:HlyD family secretion protein
MQKRQIFIPIILIVVVIVVAFWYVTTQNTKPIASALTGSGTVETIEVAISPEVAGRIVEVLVSDGDTVNAGDPLFRLDDTLLSAQRDQAQTNLTAAQSGLDVANTALTVAQASINTAQAQYDLELALARQQAQPVRSAAWSQTEPSEFDQPVWYFTLAEQITATQEEVSAASTALATAQADFNSLVSSGGYADLAAAETRLAQARTAFLDAKDVLDRAQRQSNQSLRDIAQQAFDASKAELDAAQQAYDELLSTQETSDILEARAHLAVAQERYDTALDRYNALLTGEDSLRVRVAAASLAQAQASVTQAESKITQARTVIDQAQAALDLINIQIEKLVIYAPVSGVVLARNIEPGEVVQPGATALTLGQLDQLTITVYIPEDRYGEVSLGDSARVSVDSFPNQTFEATVTRIADTAEFTPRNVQTAEGRRTTVFAVELSVRDPNGQLKPGMPADVTFGQR